jgi:hypothetical protein
MWCSNIFLECMWCSNLTQHSDLTWQQSDGDDKADTSQMMLCHRGCLSDVVDDDIYLLGRPIVEIVCSEDEDTCHLLLAWTEGGSGWLIRIIIRQIIIRDWLRMSICPAAHRCPICRALETWSGLPEDWLKFSYLALSWKVVLRVYLGSRARKHVIRITLRIL